MSARERPENAGDDERPSAMFDYIKNGGDDLALAKASLEHALGCLGREIELHAETRKLLAEMLAALKTAEKSDETHANCVECEGLGAPEACEKCFPLADDARCMRRVVLAKARGVSQ